MAAANSSKCLETEKVKSVGWKDQPAPLPESVGHATGRRIVSILREAIVRANAPTCKEARIGEDGKFEAAVIASEGETRRVSMPSILGRRLTYIPAVFIGPHDLAPEPPTPPLNDLCNAVLAHYSLQSEYRQALHMTASPQPVATGFAAEEVPRIIGPSTIIRSSNLDAKFQFVSFSGDGIAEQRLVLAASRADMAAIGISILVPKGSSNLAARSIELRQHEDNSLTVSIINSVKAGLNRLVAFM